MKKIKRMTAFASAICLCMAMATGCGDSKSSSEITEKELEKAASELDEEKIGSKDEETTEQKKQEVDPFEKLNVTFEGVSPAGNIKISSNSSSIGYTPDKEKGLRNGDVVTITANVSALYAEDYELTATEKQYTVEGLPECAEKIEDIPQDTYDKMDKTFRDSYAAFLADPAQGVEGTINSMELLGNYMLVKKDMNNPENKNFARLLNRLYFVYKINADFARTGENHEYYWCAYYDNVNQLPDGTMDVNYDELNKGSMDFDLFTVDVFYVEGCSNLDSLFSKNVTSMIDEYDYVSTVKE